MLLETASDGGQLLEERAAGGVTKDWALIFGPWPKGATWCHLVKWMPQIFDNLPASSVVPMGLRLEACYGPALGCNSRVELR